MCHKNVKITSAILVTSNHLISRSLKMTLNYSRAMCETESCLTLIYCSWTSPQPSPDNPAAATVSKPSNCQEEENTLPGESHSLRLKMCGKKMTSNSILKFLSSEKPNCKTSRRALAVGDFGKWQWQKGKQTKFGVFLQTLSDGCMIDKRGKQREGGRTEERLGGWPSRGMTRPESAM